MRIATILITVLFVSSSGKLVMDHNFRPNESASFLSGVDEIKSALNSLKSCIPNSYDLARQNAEYARMILTNDTIKELKGTKFRKCHGITTDVGLA